MKILLVIAFVLWTLACGLAGLRIGMYACESHFKVGDFQSESSGQ